MKNILIAYGTRYGSTEETAEEIKSVLEKHDCNVRLLDLKTTKEKEWPSLDTFDGVIVGSSIKIMKWMKEPKRFLEQNRNKLNSNDMNLGIFVSSMFASEPENRQEIHDKCISEIMAELKIDPDISAAFGGVFDFSSASKMGFLDKQMAKIAAKGMEADFGYEINRDAKNDFRDWDQIRKFAEDYLALQISPKPLSD
jgi:menaquinone-dependent protoporphyrinogen IX oxidase